MPEWCRGLAKDPGETLVKPEPEPELRKKVAHSHTSSAAVVSGALRTLSRGHDEAASSAPTGTPPTQQVSRTMGQPIYATPTKPFLTNTYLELYVIIGITIFSSTVLFCIFKDVKRRDAIRRTLSGARLCGMDKVA
mgnify:CR=1 FL=1